MTGAPPAPTPPAAPAAPSPAPAAPAKPAAPTPAPAAPAPPATPPAAPATPSFKPGNFDDMDALLGDTPPEPPKPSTPAATPPKPGTTGPAPTPDPKDAADGVPEFKTNKELREWAKTRHKLAKDTEAKAAQLEARLKEMESRTGVTPQTEELTKRIADYDKRVEQYESQLRLLNYRKSQEYKTKYEAPIDTAVDAAHREVEELEVQTLDEDGEVTGTRAATKMDFNRIYHLPSKDARKLAKEMFGEDADVVLSHRRRIRELSDQADKEISEYEKKGAEAERQQNLQAQTQMEAAQRMYREANDGLSKKYPTWFGEVEGDQEGNDLLRKGFELVDSAMGPNRASLSLENRIILDARIRNQAAGFMRLAAQTKKLKAELEAKEKLIAELRGSGPGAGNGAGGGPEGGKPTPKTWEDGFESMVPN